MFHVYRVLVMGHKGPLQWADVYKVYNEDSLQTLCSVFEHHFNKRHGYCEVMVKIQNKYTIFVFLPQWLVWGISQFTMQLTIGIAEAEHKN